MLVAALLLVGFGCLVVGVLLASTPWLLGSLAAGAVAAVALYRRRSRIGSAVPQRAASPDARRERAESPAPVAAAVVAGSGFAARGGPGRSRPPSRADLRVWVIDGRAAFHLGQCPLLDELPAGVVPERIPLDQALEDGFVPCPTCDPSEDRIAAGSDAAVDDADRADPALGAGEVWVVDGRPQYHRSGCRLLAGQPAEPVPAAQAVADGFVPCSACGSAARQP